MIQNVQRERNSQMFYDLASAHRHGSISHTTFIILQFMSRMKLPMSQDRIAEVVGVCRRSVVYAINHAEQYGLLKRVHTRKKHGRRWVNGVCQYIWSRVAIAEKRPFPWRRSMRNVCTTCQTDIKKQPRNPHTVSEYLEILARMGAGLSAQEAGYRGSG